MAPCISVGVAADGTLTYLIPSPAELPPVLGRDLMAAWNAAHEAARGDNWGERRRFRFRQSDGEMAELAIGDADACCWAAAVDRWLGLTTLRGVSVCLRLLALIQILCGGGWSDRLAIEAGEAALHPALLSWAAQARLTDEAAFEEPGPGAGPGIPFLPERAA